jgi:hypothetical protein
MAASSAISSPEFGRVPLAVNNRLVQAFHLDRLRTFAVQPALFAFMPLSLGAVAASQAINQLVVVSPILVFRSAGNPVLDSLGERPVTLCQSAAARVMMIWWSKS